MNALIGMFLTALLGAGPAPQEGEESSAAIRKEAAFAKALTVELGYDDLSEVVLERALQQAQREERGTLLLARCDVRKFAAQRAQDNEQRLATLGLAGEAYAEFLATDPPPRLASAAELALGDVAYQYGSALKVVLDTTQPSAEQRQSMLAVADKVFLAALEGLNKLIDSWNELPEGDEKETTKIDNYFQPLFFRALVYYHWGLLYPDGSVEMRENTRKALELLADFAFLVGEGSQAGLLAYKYMADAYVARGEIEDGESFYQYVIDSGVPEDTAGITPTELDGRRGVIQAAYLGYLRMLLGRGLLTEAQQLGQTFQTWVKNDGVVLNEEGYRVLLQLARGRILAGGYDQAIAVAEQVARENERNVLRLEANDVMAAAIAAAPEDAAIDLSVVYGAAEGAFYQKKFAQSLDGFRMLLGRLRSDADRDNYGAAAYYFLGRSYYYLDQRLESAVTHQLGFSLYPDHEEYAPKNADAWHKLAEQFRNQAPADRTLDDFYSEAVAALAAASGGDAPDSVLWRAAQTDYDLAKRACSQAQGKAAGAPETKAAFEALDKAIAKYNQIERGSRYYESALVQKGMCEFRKAEWEAQAAERAFRLFNDYLEVYVPNPENNPQDPRGRKVRRESAAQADFYRGQVRYRQAVQSGGEPAWRAVLSAYAGYLERNSEQRDYGAASLVYRLEAHLSLGEAKEATARYDELVAGNFDDARIAQAAHLMFRHFEKLAAVEGDPARKREHVQAAANYLHAANERSARPRWQNLAREARLRLDLGESATATALLESVLQKFADDPSFTPEDRFFTQLDLVESYLAQDKPALAAPAVDQLLKERPTNLRVMEMSIDVLVGWPAARDGGVVEIPGVSTAEALDKASKLVDDLNLLAEAEAQKQNQNKYNSPDFWRARLQKAYLLYRRAQVDSSYAGQHLRLIESLERLAPELGGDVVGPDLKRTFLWLKAR